MKFHPRRMLLALSVLMLFLAVSPLAYANVNIEYLGPYPLHPAPVPGQTRTLAAKFTVGNDGDEPTRLNMTVWSTTANFFSHFTARLSDNGFQLNVTVRKQITLTLFFDTSTPIQGYSAHVGIMASALSYPPGSSPGHATFDLPVTISPTDITPPTTTVTTATSSTSSTATTSSTSPTSTASTSSTSKSTTTTPITPPPAQTPWWLWLIAGAIILLLIILLARRRKSCGCNCSFCKDDKHLSCKQPAQCKYARSDRKPKHHN